MMNIEDEILGLPWRMVGCCNDGHRESPLYQGIFPVCNKDYTPEPVLLALRIKHNCMSDEDREYRRAMLAIKTLELRYK